MVRPEREAHLLQWSEDHGEFLSLCGVRWLDAQGQTSISCRDLQDPFLPAPPYRSSNEQGWDRQHMDLM